MRESGPVIKPLARQWIEGKISTADYYEQVYADELPLATAQVEAKLAERRQLRHLQIGQTAINFKQ